MLPSNSAFYFEPPSSGLADWKDTEESPVTVPSLFAPFASPAAPLDSLKSAASLHGSFLLERVEAVHYRSTGRARSFSPFIEPVRD